MILSKLIQVHVSPHSTHGIDVDFFDGWLKKQKYSSYKNIEILFTLERNLLLHQNQEDRLFPNPDDFLA